MNSKSRSVSFGIATFFAVTASFAYLSTASTAQGHAAATAAATKAGAVAATAAATAAHTAPHWTYEGAEGPDEWGTLDNSFAT